MNGKQGKLSKRKGELQFKYKWHYYVAQVTSRGIACSDWLRGVTCRSVIFRIGLVRITGFVSHFVHERTTKINFKKP